MTAKKCDRCGKYYDLNRDGKYILRKVNVLSDGNCTVDLCEECSNDLQEWFNTPRKIEESEEKK